MTADDDDAAETRIRALDDDQATDAGSRAVDESAEATRVMQVSDGSAPATTRERAVLRFGDPATLPMLLAGLLAWAITVAPAAFAHGSGLRSAALGALDLGAAVCGPALVAARPRLGRHVGITAFVALATLAWLSSSLAIHPQRLDPIRGVFGALAWGVFALSWSERWAKSAPLPADADAAALQARARLPRLAVPIASAGVGAAVVLIALAWRIADPDRALVAHAVAVAAAVGVISSAATVATSRGRRRSSSGRRFTSAAVRNLVLFAVAALAGAVLVALR
jgi:hypothetical protein